MDTVLLLLFVSAMSLIAGVFVVGSRSRTSKPVRSPRKSSRRSTGARKKSTRKKSAKQGKSRYEIDDDDLFDMIFDAMLGGDRK